MKIGIMSDTHDHMTRTRHAVDLMMSRHVEAVIHAGDFISPLTFDSISHLDAPFYGVFGNNDGEKYFLRKRFAAIGELHERFFIIELGGLKLLVTHENEVVESLARSGDYDVVIYGHTHVTDIRTIGRTLLINPGEVCGWLNGRPTIAILDTETRQTELIALQ